MNRTDENIIVPRVCLFPWINRLRTLRDADDRLCVDLSSGGLCNRLKSLVSAMRLAHHQNRKLFVFWGRHPELDCPFHRLFENHFRWLSRRPDPRHRSTYLPHFLLWLPPDEMRDGFSLAWTQKHCEHRWLSEQENRRACIDGEYDRIPEDLKKRYGAYFQSLRPARRIKDKVERLAGTFTDQTLGVHARRGDHMLKSDRNMGTDEAFESALDREIEADERTRFFLATDETETEARMLKRYGARIIRHPKRGFGRTAEGIEDAAVDLYLLSKTKRLIGSFWSTFTEVAWWLGGCRPGTVIVR